MAMLAERRERKRYNLVPRGKALYEDDNRFGTRMLEKMGWSKGKGLGANEDGTREFVRIRYKNDNVGLGFEDRNDQWTQHEESFDGLLKTLNTGSCDDSVNSKPAEEEEETPVARGFGYPKEDVSEAPKMCISGESLEEKSKKSRARVHYMKFTRGKDISGYSEKDLANIFGKKSLLVEDKQNLEKEEGRSSNEVSQKTSDNEEEQNFRFGVPTVNSGTSVNDYFKAKLEALRNKSKSVRNSNGMQETEPQQIKEEKANDGGNPDEQTPKKKKRRKVGSEDEKVFENCGSEENLINEPETEKPPKKKKKSKSDTVNEIESLDDQNVCREDTIPRNSEDLILSGEKDVSNSKQRKKSTPLDKRELENFEILEENIDKCHEENTTDISRKKKKSKRNEHDEEISEGVVHNENNTSRIGSKKSKRKSVALDTLSEQRLEYQSQVSSDEAKSETFTKQSKKSKSKAETTTNKDLNLSCDTLCNDDLAPKKKKKKSKKSDEIEKEITVDIGIPEEINSTNELCSGVKKSKKKKKKTEEESQGTSESENSRSLVSVETPSNKEVIKSKTNEENKISEDNDIESNTAQPILDVQSQQVSTSVSSVTSTIDNIFRFPELNRKRKKKEPTKIEISLQSDPKNEEEFEYKMSGFAAEKFYNVNIEGFPGSNFEDIIGYGLSGRVKIEVVHGEADIFKIKAFYQKELARMEASGRRNNSKNNRFGKKVKKKDRTLFPKLL